MRWLLALLLVVAGTVVHAAGSLPIAEVEVGAERLAPVRPQTMRVAATGDILLHSPLWRQGQYNAAYLGTGEYDYRPMFAPIRSLLESADLAICHLETPIAPAGEAFSTDPKYGVQPELAAAIAYAGYDRCSTASNHTYDRGTAGIDRTIDVLREHGLGQSGMAKSPTGIEPALIDVDGVFVSHLSYTWSYNGLRLPSDQTWRSALIDPDRIIADSRQARELGAEVVIVSLHFGVEGSHVVSDYQRHIAELITASGSIDLVIGHHAHVVQPVDLVNGTWVMFGTGNVLSNLPVGSGWPAATQDAAVFFADITVHADRSVTVERPIVHPTYVDKYGGWVIRPVIESIASGEHTGRTLDELHASLARTGAVLGDYFPG